jgi:phenylacetic acid degradation operon negative regulatory protein
MRALSLLGFRELDAGLYIRPNNLSGGVEGIRSRLFDLQLEPEAAVFQASHFDKDRQKKSLGLWAQMQLEAHYKKVSNQLSDWQKTQHSLDNETALRDAYLLGDFAIRNVVFDPLLPAPLVEESARQRFFDTVRQFNAEGRKLWYAFFTKVN